MSRIVKVIEKQADTLKTFDIGSRITAPQTVQDRYDNNAIIRGEIKEFQDEGHRISAKCVAEHDGNKETFFLHFTVGNLTRIYFDPVERDTDEN